MPDCARWRIFDMHQLISRENVQSAFYPCSVNACIFFDAIVTYGCHIRRIIPESHHYVIYLQRI